MPSNRQRKRLSRRGAILVWIAVLLPALLGFVGLTVDVGRLFADKANLQAFADVSALTGALYLPDTGEASNRAGANLTTNDASAGGALGAGDIEFGNWNPDTRVFTVGGSPTDGIRLTASHDSAHGNPVPLVFMPIFNNDFANVSAVAIGHAAPRVGGRFSGGIIGEEYVLITGTAYIDGYKPEDGPYGGSNANLPGTALSNGTMTVRGNPVVVGDARPGVDYTEARVQGNAEVEGTTAGLTRNLDLAPVEIPGSITSGANNNDSVTAVRDSNGNSVDPINGSNAFDTGTGITTTIPAGDYYFSSMNTQGTVNITGPARIRVAGDWDVTGQGVINTNGLVEFYVEGDADLRGQGIINQTQNPDDLVIYSTGDEVHWRGTSDFYGHIYGPFDPIIKINGSNEYYGTAVGRGVEVLGTGDIHTDRGNGFDGPNRKLPILVD